MDNEFFRISGIVTAKHDDETREIWASFRGCKSDHGRKAIMNYAKAMKFNYNGDEEEYTIEDVKNAFEYLLSTTSFPKAFGIRSCIAREAIKNYS